MRMLLNISIWMLMVMVSAAQAQTTQTATTLRSLGAVGDGKTDDRAAIEEALNKSGGAPIDGEGLTYAVNGTVRVEFSVNLRNAKLVQVMKPGDASKFFSGGWGNGTAVYEPADLPHETKKGLPAMSPLGHATYANDPVPTEAEHTELMKWIGLRTLAIAGDDNRLISITLENVTIDRGKYPEIGGRNDGAGIKIENASPVVLRNVEITGHGKGTGIGISNCKDVKMERLNIHDMHWAPYPGDKIFEVLNDTEVRDLFAYNNFPIYEYRAAMKRFVRVRVQEQLSGMFLAQSENVELIDSKFERLGTIISGKFYPLQADGITVNRTTNTLIRDSEFNEVWEGIDFTGGDGSDFLFQDNRSVGVLAWAFKLAHTKQNGKIIRCIAERAGVGGFTMSGDQHNITISDSVAYENGAEKYMINKNGDALTTITGFHIVVTGPPSPTPRNLRIERCKAINREHPNLMEYGMVVESPRGQQDVVVTDFESEGAREGKIHGLPEGEPGGRS